WSAALLPRRALGPNILARLELLSRILSGAGVSDTQLNVAIWALWNHVMGATITRVSFGLSEGEQEAAQQRLAQLGGRYPTIERSRLLLDDDWDGAFRKGLNFLLDGLKTSRPPRSGSRLIAPGNATAFPGDAAPPAPIWTCRRCRVPIAHAPDRPGAGPSATTAGSCVWWQRSGRLPIPPATDPPCGRQCSRWSA